MKIAVIMENLPTCISGGRYYTWMVASMLGEMGHSVSLFTDNLSEFYFDAFRYYKQPKVSQTDLTRLDISGFDVYVGAPFGGCIVAHRLATRQGAWCVNIMLDPQPLVDRHIPKKGGNIYRHVPMKRFKEAMRDCTIMSNSAYAVPFIQDWLDNQDVIPVTATVNEKAARASGNHKRRDIVTTITRWEGHKGILDAFHAVKRLPGKPEFHVITSFGDKGRIEQEGRRREVNTHVHFMVSEEKKFAILKQSRLFIFPSHYEGQGIPVLEAQLVKTPGVCYNFPVMAEMAPDWRRAKYRDNNDLAEKAKQTWKERKAAPIRRGLKRLRRELGAIF